MFRELITLGIPELNSFIKMLKLNFYFSKPQIRHIQSFIAAVMFYGYSGKLSNISGTALNVCRTSIGGFLESGAWKEEYLLREMQKHVIKRVWEESKKTGKPIYVIYYR